MKMHDFPRTGGSYISALSKTQDFVIFFNSRFFFYSSYWADFSNFQDFMQVFLTHIVA